MSDTPETDLLLSRQEVDRVPPDEACDQLIDLCQQLERERDEARLLGREAELEIKDLTIRAQEWEASSDVYSERASEWRECAEGLAAWMRSLPSFNMAAVDALAEFDRLKEAK